MMITKFNKRKCLFKEIVKIPELCYCEVNETGGCRRETSRGESSIPSIFFLRLSTACFVIKISQMHAHNA